MRAFAGRTRKTLIVTTVLALTVVTLVSVSPWLLQRAGIAHNALPWTPPCVVHTDEGTVGLSREEAQRATTAVALEARGTEHPPDTSGIDTEVWERLRSGPSADAGPSLTCHASGSNGLETQELRESGLTPRAAKVRSAMEDAFGEQSLGGYEPGGVQDGHGEDSAHYEGRAIDVFYRPVSEKNRRQGWLLAHWLVAHAETLNIANVIFDDRIWNVHGSLRGWWDYDSPDPDNDILSHRDHVHVDVQQGSK